MMLGTFGASLLGNILARKRPGKRWFWKQKRKRNCKNWLWKRVGFLMPPHSVTNFEIKSIIRMNQDLKESFQEIICLKKIKDAAYVINLDEYGDVGTHWISLFCDGSEIVYFNSFGVEHVPEEI